LVEDDIDVPEGSLHRSRIPHVAPQELHTARPNVIEDSAWLGPDPVDLGVEVVENAYIVAALHECVHQVGSNESGTPGYEDLSVSRHVSPHLRVSKWIRRPNSSEAASGMPSIATS
jgi:hypothetical protein